MSIKYGSLDHKPPNKKKKSKDEIEIKDELLTADALEKHLCTLAYKSSSPHVRKASTAELPDRKAPKSKNPEQNITASDARRICDIYEEIQQMRAISNCPHCGKEIAN